LTVLASYRERLRDLDTVIAAAQLRGNNSVLLLAAALAAFLAGFYSAVTQGLPPGLTRGLLVLPVVIAVVAGRRLKKDRASRYTSWRLAQYYKRGIARLEANWTGAIVNGEDFRESGHPYSNDLNLFGDGSLFELLSTARTSNGERGLADYLRLTPPIAESRLRQEAVRELAPRVDLREQIVLLGDYDFTESKRETFDEWFETPAYSVSRPLQIAALLSLTLVVLLVLAGAVGLLPWLTFANALFPVLGFQAAVGLFYRARVNALEPILRPISLETKILRDGLALLESAGFKSPKLQNLTARVRDSSTAVRRLERLLNAQRERHKEWFYAPSLFLMLGTQLFLAIEDWRAQHGAALRRWLEAWAEFEALNSLAGYAYENPSGVYPDLVDADTAFFEAASLGHPLLPASSCVRNDAALSEVCRFYVVSGSNMSGKSTLLRAIGLNAVLAFAGAPVRAQSLRLSALSICASLSVVDSLLNGKSKFLAEMDRLRLMLATVARHEPVLFLIDEILSGTNSRDRRIASEAVVRTLIAGGAIGALSTHDLALTDIASLEDLHGANVHMGSRDGGEPMDFDFILKPGPTTEANALAIARMAGVPV
jgi:hypothetical protein